MMKTSEKIRGHLFAAFCLIVWSVTFLASKRLLAYYSPVQLMFMRFVVAYAALWILCPRWERTSLREEALYLCMGLLGCTLYFWTENTALTLTYTANVSTLVALAPILTALLMRIVKKDRRALGRWVWTGFALAMSGVVLVVCNGTIVFKLSPKGDLLALATAFIWAAYTVLQERALVRRSSLFITRKVMLYGVVTCLPLFLLSGMEGFSLRPLFASFTNTALFLFLAVLGSACCYLAWCSAERTLGAFTTTNYIYAIPFVTMTAAAMLLGEPISLMGGLGAVLIVAGVWVSSRGGREGETAFGEGIC